jgi:hypothetical protein
MRRMQAIVRQGLRALRRRLPVTAMRRPAAPCAQAHSLAQTVEGLAADRVEVAVLYQPIEATTPISSNAACRERSRHQCSGP